MTDQLCGTDRAILDLLSEDNPMTAKEIAGAIGIDEKSVYTYIRRLRDFFDDEAIESTKYGYVLNEHSLTGIGEVDAIFQVIQEEGDVTIQIDITISVE